MYVFVVIILTIWLCSVEDNGMADDDGWSIRVSFHA